MSIFGSKTKIQVFSFTSPLLETDEFAMRDAVLYAVLKEEDISDILVKQALASTGARVDSAMQYARDVYTLGLPNNHHSSSDQIAGTVVADAITEDLALPYGCLVQKNFRVPLTPATAVLPYLLDTRKLSINTGVIGSPPAAWVTPDAYAGHTLTKYFTIGDVILLDDTVTVQVTYRAVLKYAIVTTIDENTVTTVYIVPTTEYADTFTETQTIPTGMQMSREYLMAGYSVLDAAGAASAITDWWYYSMDSGEYPELTPDIGPPGGYNSYPVVPLRYNNQFISSTNSPEIYDTGKNLLRRMGLGFDSLVSSLDSNPDIAEIDHAYTMFGVDVQTDSALSLGYLADFFTYLADSDDDTIWDALGGSNSKLNSFSFGSYTNTSGVAQNTTNRTLEGSTDIVQTKVINPAQTMSLTEHGLKIDITYKSITSVLVTGSIGAVGHAAKEIIPSSQYSETGTRRVDNSKLILRHQVATNVYREVIVTGLVHTNQIYGNHSVVTTVADVAGDPDEHNMVIPLHYTVAHRRSMAERSMLYEETLRLVINGYKSTKIKWYNSSIFKFAVLVVAVVVAVVTVQPWIADLALAAQAGTMALAVFLMESLIFSIALQYAATELAKVLGPDLAFLAAVVAVVAAIKMGRVDAVANLIPAAEALMMSGMALIGGANTAQQEMLEDINNEYNEFMVDAEAQQAILDAKLELLQSDAMLPLSYMMDAINHPKPKITTKPDEIYDQVHRANVGTLCLDVIENYVNMSLLLPEPDYN